MFSVEIAINGNRVGGGW